MTGKYQSYGRNKSSKVLADHMTFFVVIEPIQIINSQHFAKAKMKILLQHDTCHIVIYDTDSKFKLHFRQALESLNELST